MKAKQRWQVHHTNLAWKGLIHFCCCLDNSNDPDYDNTNSQNTSNIFPSKQKPWRPSNVIHKQAWFFPSSNYHYFAFSVLCTHFKGFSALHQHPLIKQNITSLGHLSTRFLPDFLPEKAVTSLSFSAFWTSIITYGDSWILVSQAPGNPTASGLQSLMKSLFLVGRPESMEKDSSS